LSGAIEVVSVERHEPGRKNRLEYDFVFGNTGDAAVQLTSDLTWLDDGGGQSFDLHVAPGGEARLTAPTNDRRVSSHRMALRPAGAAAKPAPDGGAIVISAAAVNATAYGTLAIAAGNGDLAYEVVIPDSACRRFQFYPGGGCSASATTPAGSTTTFMVAYRAGDARQRRGSLLVDFADGEHADVAVPLVGRVGDGKKGFRTISPD
jgi:hypothetical protein